MSHKKKDDLSGEKRLLEMLKDPQYKELVDMMDCIIVFENGRHKRTIRVNEK